VLHVPCRQIIRWRLSPQAPPVRGWRFDVHRSVRSVRAVRDLVGVALKRGVFDEIVRSLGSDCDYRRVTSLAQASYGQSEEERAPRTDPTLDPDVAESASRTSTYFYVIDLCHRRRSIAALTGRPPPDGRSFVRLTPAERAPPAATMLHEFLSAHGTQASAPSRGPMRPRGDSGDSLLRRV